MTYPHTPYPGGNDENNLGAGNNGPAGASGGANPYGAGGANGFGGANAFGAGSGMPNPGQKPNNYLVWTILSTILCCVPIGAVSIYFSTRVDNYWNQGQYDQALDASNKAKLWAIIAAVVGIIFSIGYVIFSVSYVGTQY